MPTNNALPTAVSVAQQDFERILEQCAERFQTGGAVDDSPLDLINVSVEVSEHARKMREDIRTDVQSLADGQSIQKIDLEVLLAFAGVNGLNEPGTPGCLKLRTNEDLRAEHLWIRDKGAVESLKQLMNLVALRSLTLHNTDLQNMNDLSYLTQITALRITFHDLKGLSPIASLTNIERLEISEGILQDISVLGRLTGLNWLDLQNNKLRDITPLAALGRLTYLNIAENQVAEVSALINLPLLEELDLGKNPLNSIEGLDKLTRLRKLEISETPLQDFAPLLNIPALEELTVLNKAGESPSPAACLIFEQLSERGVLVRWD